MGKPDAADRLLAHAAQLHRAGEIAAAIKAYQEVVEQAPHHAGGLNLLGLAYAQIGEAERAVPFLQKALALNPNLPSGHYNLGRILQGLHRYEEARRHYELALAQQPSDAELHSNLGTVLRSLDRAEEAVTHFRRALELNPDFAEVHCNLGNALVALGRNEEALRSYDCAMRLIPEDARPKSNKAHLKLALGQFDEGWRLFEHRWAAKGVEPRPYGQPRWNGGFVEGTLLLWAEQGLGDQILFSSMIEDLRDRATSICLEVEPRLVPLLARSFPYVEVLPLGPQLYAGPVAVQEPLLSLGRQLRPTWESFGRAKQGYLKADAARTRELRARLAHDGRHVIGLSWQSKSPSVGKAKTASLQEFKAVLRFPGCRFIDLQYGDTREEREVVRRDLGVEVERLEDVDNLNDIDGLAALISACDMVVTVSNTTAHLAGAIGAPVWVLIPAAVGRVWYWFRDRQDSPWYPSAQLRRQMLGQSWADLIATTASEFARALPQNALP